MRFANLPFVEIDSNGAVLCTWKVSTSGCYSQDCTTGRQYFGLLKAVMLREGNPTLLSRVLEGQIKAGALGGIETGFHAALAEAALN